MPRESLHGGQEGERKGKKLSSGVHVWYPSHLYNKDHKAKEQAATSSLDKAPASTSARKFQKRTDSKPKRISPPSDRIPRKTLPLKRKPISKADNSNKDGEKKHVASLKIKAKSEASCGRHVKLKSGVSVWYPEALFPKSTTSTSTVFPHSETLCIVKDDTPVVFPRLPTLSDQSKPKGKQLSSPKRSASHEANEAGDTDDDDVVYIETKKITKRLSGKEAELHRPPRQVIAKKKAVEHVATKNAANSNVIVEAVEDVEMAEISSSPAASASSPAGSSSSNDDEVMEIDAVETVKHLRDESRYTMDNIPIITLPEQRILQAPVIFDLVLDTNIFLSDEGGRFLVALSRDELKGLPVIQIRIPHVVFIELDRLKTRTEKSISGMAIQAIRFLNDCILEKKDSRFIGQTATEYKLGMEDFPALINDDRILIYANQIISNTPNQVICITNDVNLQTRAVVNNLRAISGNKLYDEVRKCLRKESSIFDTPATSSIATHFPIGQVRPPQLVPSVSEPPHLLCLQLDECVKNVLLRLLSGMVESRMKQIYEDLWRSVVKSLLPWPSVPIITGLITNQHWIAAFSDIFNRDDKNMFATLGTITHNQAPSPAQMENLLVHAMKTVAVVSRLDVKMRTAYEEDLVRARVLVSRWKDLFARSRAGIDSWNVLINECQGFLHNCL